MKKTPSRLLLGVSLASFIGFFSAGGCALVAGIEKRSDGGASGTGDGDQGGDGDGLVDKETDIITSELCIEYCDEVTENCTGDNAVYAARKSCINVCNALPEGDEAEPFRNNSVYCRLDRAKAAASAPDDECVAAGPGGDPSCGGNCEAWCHLMESECPDDFDPLFDCMAACESIEDRGGLDVVEDYSQDNIQCRLIHLGAVGGDPESVHCGHARFIPAETCVPPADAEPTCAEYCHVVTAICVGDRAVYESEQQCEAACAAFDTGTLADTSENTVGCRTYHSKAAAQDPQTHCVHSGPTGAGTCGSYDRDEDITGPCESYCQLLSAGCSSTFTDAFSSVQECAESCKDDFKDRGAENGSPYTAATAKDEDGLSCRTYYAVIAMEEAAGDGDNAAIAAACGKAAPDGTCD